MHMHVNGVAVVYTHCLDEFDRLCEATTIDCRQTPRWWQQTRRGFTGAVHRVSSRL